MEDSLFAGFFVILIGVIIGCGIYAFLHRDDFSDACKAQGGHVKNVNTSGMQWVDGKYKYVVSGFDLCISADGRIIE